MKGAQGCPSLCHKGIGKVDLSAIILYLRC
jgi:hypothetical protein